MPTIVYCYHLPSEDQPTPPLLWDAFEPDGEPRSVGIVPKILNTDEEQLIFRSIAPFLNEIVAVQVVGKDLRKKDIPQLVAAGQYLPRTFIGDSYTPRDNLKGTLAYGRVQGLDFRMGYDKIVQQHAVRMTMRYPGRKCVDLVAVHDVKDRIERRKYEKGLPWAEPAPKRTSIIAVTKGFMDKELPKIHGCGEYTDKLAVIPLAPIPTLNTSLKPAQNEERELMAEAHTAIVPFDAAPATPARPPRERQYAGRDAPEASKPRYYWMDQD